MFSRNSFPTARDITSTLDDAIKYIKTLQYQIQMMPMAADYPMCHSSMMMMPQPGNLGMQIPFPFLQTNGLTQIGMGMSGMFPSYNVPMSQLGFPAPSELPSLGGITASNPGNFLQQPRPATSSMDIAPSPATSSGFSRR